MQLFIVSFVTYLAYSLPQFDYAQLNRGFAVCWAVGGHGFRSPSGHLQVLQSSLLVELGLAEMVKTGFGVGD